MQHDVSVIVPVYNVEKYLPACLDSIVNQDFDNYDIIVVNDGSPDNSLVIAKDYAKRYPGKIKVISQENKGLGGARNTGIDQSDGKYILFVDSDDTIKPHTIKTLYNRIEETGADIALFGAEHIDENGNTIARISAIDEDFKVFTLDEFPLILSTDPYAWNKMYKASLFKENDIRFPERLWYEDLHTTPKLILKASKMVSIKEYFYNYLIRSNSIMHTSKNVEKNSDMIAAVNDIISFFKSNGVFDKYYDQLEFMAVFHIMTLCTLRVCSVSARDPLLAEFREYTAKHFPNYKKNKYIHEYFSFKYKLMFFLSSHRMYKSLHLLNSLNEKKKVFHPKRINE